MKFKVGDRVKHNKRGLGTVRAYTNGGYSAVEYDNSFIGGHDLIFKAEGVGVLCEDGHGWYEIEDHLELLKEGKQMKPKKVDKHILIQDDCFNVIEIMDSLTEAKATGKDKGTEEPCTVYKLVPVYHYEPSVKETKVKG